ncbi:hypothetical protein GPECTOR_25g316 [Gonium pectorale]|uniref:Uncharacterized protein n=1 Tax=Gonium pectorale TaxID=33097 RepID=A0A150GFX0_GONPE|nr:hypothetical protein GPECTOR_25g316 [Gonium pectorale]|eukprot:KXZ48732.1 hypothetical protein GPECTOR_25g316 [Gonium pectorale]
MDVLDPDVAAQLYVLQWMHENGHHDALKALEKQLGKLYDDSALPEASQLMQARSRGWPRKGSWAGRAACVLVWRDCEEKLRLQQDADDEGDAAASTSPASGPASSSAPASAAATTFRRAREEEALRLLRAGADDYAGGSVLAESAPVAHRGANVIAVRLLPGSDRAITAAGDGHVRCLRFGRLTAGSSGGDRCGSSGGDGDRGGDGGDGGDGDVEVMWETRLGSAALLSLALHPHYRQPHTKYVVRVVWAGTSAAAVASGDGHVAPAAEVGAAGEEGVEVPYGAAVADVTFLPDGRTLVVGVRGSNYLRLLDTEALVGQAGGAGGGSSGAVPERLVNMNETGDDHVSFSVRHLSVSYCGQYLLICTDGPRLLVLRTSDWSRLRLLFGLPVDQFPQPVAAWHRDSNYVYVAGANAQLCVFHLGSGRLVATFRHHRINIRDLHYDPDRNLLASCGFDKSVKLMRGPP